MPLYQQIIFYPTLLSLLSALVLIAIFFISFKKMQDHFSLLWIAGWFFYALRSVFLLLALFYREMDILQSAGCTSIAASSFFLLMAPLHLLIQKRNIFQITAIALGTFFFLLTIASFIFPGRESNSVVMLISGLIYIFISWSFLQLHRRYVSIGMALSALAFFLWGLLRLSYLFSLTADWIIPTKLVLVTSFSIMSGIGILLFLYERSEKTGGDLLLRYAALFNNNKDAMFLLSPPGNSYGNIIDANEEALHWTGLSRVDIIGKNIFDLFPADREKITKDLDSEGSVSCLLDISSDRIILQTPQKAEVLIYPIKQSHRHDLLMIMRNITPLVLARKLARQTETKFLHIFDNAPLGIGMASTEGILFQANQKFAAMLGYTPDELLGRSLQSLTYYEDLDMNKLMIQDLITQKIQDYTIEKRYLRKDGSIFWARLLRG